MYLFKDGRWKNVARLTSCLMNLMKEKQTNVVKLYRRSARLSSEMSGFCGMDKCLPCQSTHVAKIASEFHSHMFSWKAASYEGLEAERGAAG